MSGTSWRYDARQMACNPDLCPIFVEPPELPDDSGDDE